MQTPSIPADEQARLDALERTGLLDSPPSAAFDRVTRTAAELLGVPVVLVSLVDAHRQWFMSRHGLETTETPREVSFCGHTVFMREPLVVPDAASDPRFGDNPLVTGEPRVRAYLGIPILAGGGQPVGALCAIDHRPRQFTERDVLVLSRMARIVEQLIAALGAGARADASD